MIIKSFKTFESTNVEYETFVVKINSREELEYVMDYIGKIDSSLYNKNVLNTDYWYFPNFLFVYKDDISRMYSLDEPNLELLDKRLKRHGVYPHILNIYTIHKLNYLLKGKLDAKKLYSPRKIDR